MKAKEVEYYNSEYIEQFCLVESQQYYEKAVACLKPLIEMRQG